jgi:hypothetical protein
MAPALSKALRVASILLCLVVALSMVLFAANQTSTASGHQREELGETVTTHPAGATKEGGFHKAVDEVADEVTSPVSGVVSSSSEWGEHIVRLLFALIVYGFGLGYLARVLRVRT